MKVLAVIPARGGSKGIPRKNVRLMHHKPLIYYAIHNAQLCDAITDIAVSTDDEEIAGIALLYGAEVVERGEALSSDAVTLDPVVYDAVLQMEKRHQCTYDAVITLQPTSPLLSAATLQNAIDAFMQDTETDTYISATNAPHLAWSKDENGYFPLYKERLNRQLLPPNYLEAGAFFITKRQFVQPNSRMGKRISVFEIPAKESTDIDTINDWIVCEQQLQSKKIILRCDGYRQLGLGHVYRCLTLAYNLIGHSVKFVLHKDSAEGIEKIKASFFPYAVVGSDEEFFELLRQEKPDIVVNDCLDTEKAYIQTLRTLVPRVVTFEDLGEGSLYTDATVNALYETKLRRENVFTGEKYVVLRDEFIYSEPITPKENAKEVFVMFGGADPLNLTERVYRLAQRALVRHPELVFTFVAGPAYDCDAHGVVSAENIRVIKDAKRVSTYMANADLAFTSQGRTVFELASMGIPAIVMAQNEREQLHTFAQMENGFINLGLGNAVQDDTLEKTFEWLLTTYEIRRDMHRLMLQHPLKGNVARVKKIILGENV